MVLDTTKHDTLFGGHAEFLSGGHCTDKTCGYAIAGSTTDDDKGAGGSNVQDSSGQCCACTLGEQLLGRPNVDESTRSGQLECRLFGAAQASAHCMRYDDLWYNVYAIDAPRVVSKVDVTVMQMRRSPPLAPSTTLAAPALPPTSFEMINGTVTGPSTPPSTPQPLMPQSSDGNCGIVPTADRTSAMRIEKLAVGSQQRQSTTADGAIAATFVGDFAAAQAPVDLSGYYLLVPELRGLDGNFVAAHPQLQSNGGPDDWMLIGKEHFAVGTEGGCDKIGVSYTSFKHQQIQIKLC